MSIQVTSQRAARLAEPRELGWISARTLGYLGLALATLLAWQGIHLLVGPDLLPAPAAVWARAVALTTSGVLPEHVIITAERLLLGWAIGCLISVPLGLAMAHIPLVRRAIDPSLNFFRFIPPIAFVSLALIWFGIGEPSKVALIVYTTSFTVIIATVSGALAVDPEKLRAAQCLGASERQLLFLVRMPATVPAIITGMRLGMANSFKTIVGAEMIGAKSGVGFLIWNSRAFLDFETIFLGIAILAAMGLLFDLALRAALRPIAYRYGARL
jgi:NitT/TauT family transport system permease protein